jgi:hypothetical protein
MRIHVDDKIADMRTIERLHGDMAGSREGGRKTSNLDYWRYLEELLEVYYETANAAVSRIPLPYQLLSRLQPQTRYRPALMSSEY